MFSVFSFQFSVGSWQKSQSFNELQLLATDDSRLFCYSLFFRKHPLASAHCQQVSSCRGGTIPKHSLFELQLPLFLQARGKVPGSWLAVIVEIRGEGCDLVFNHECDGSHEWPQEEQEV